MPNEDLKARMIKAGIYMAAAIVLIIIITMVLIFADNVISKVIVTVVLAIPALVLFGNSVASFAQIAREKYKKSKSSETS